MTQRLSNSIVVSALFHAGAIALIIAITYLAGLRSGKPVDFFELVAGAGDNYMATEAPAQGTTDGNPAAVAPPEAVSSTMVVTAKAPAPVQAPKDVDFSKSVQKVAAKETAKIAAKTAAEQKAADKAAKEEEAKQQKMTIEEFRRQNPGKTPPAASPTNAPKIDAKGIAGGVAGGSTANTKGGAGGTAMTAAALGVVEAYTSMLRARLKTNLDDQKPPGLSDTLVATASMRVLADGTLSAGTIIKTSGNREFDKAVLDAIRLSKMPERPAGFDSFISLEFKAKPND